MNENLLSLCSIANKYKEQLEGLKNKYDLVLKLIELEKKEEVPRQLSMPFNSPVALSDSSQDKSMTEIIEDILRVNPFAKLTVDEIYNEIIKTDFRSKSKTKDLKRDVYARLFRMEQRKLISSAKKGGIKRYSLPLPNEKEVAKTKELVDPSKDNPLLQADLEEGRKEL